VLRQTTGDFREPVNRSAVARVPALAVRVRMLRSAQFSHATDTTLAT
jgi:hypothetical protein